MAVALGLTQESPTVVPQGPTVLLSKFAPRLALATTSTAVEQRYAR